MPSTFKFADLTGQTCYGLVFNEAGQVWNGSSFVAYNEPDFTSYDLPAVEYGTSGIYQATLPVLAPGQYVFVAKRRAGGSPAPSDLIVWQEEFETGWSGGTGARTVTVSVDDGTDPVEGARVRATKGSESYVRTTDATGEATFQLDDGTWAMDVTAALFDPATTQVVVDGNETVPVQLSAVTMPPSDAGRVTGFLYAYDEAGVEEEGVSVHLSVKSPGEVDGVALDTSVRVGTSDADGLVTFTNLFKGVTYLVRRQGGRLTETTVPADATTPHQLPSVVGSG